MATIDLRNNTEASTGQKKVEMYGESAIHLDDKTCLLYTSPSPRD